MIHTCFTFGYGGREPKLLLQLAEEHDAVVVDVRLTPFSKKTPEWSLPSLRAWLLGRYVHMRELGNVRFAGGGQIKLLDARKGVARVKLLLTLGNVILLCGERDPERCHRTVIANRLHQQTRCPVSHLPLIWSDRETHHLSRADVRALRGDPPSLFW